MISRYLELIPFSLRETAEQTENLQTLRAQSCPLKKATLGQSWTSRILSLALRRSNYNIKINKYNRILQEQLFFFLNISYYSLQQASFICKDCKYDQ